MFSCDLFSDREKRVLAWAFPSFIALSWLVTWLFGLGWLIMYVLAFYGFSRFVDDVLQRYPPRVKVEPPDPKEGGSKPRYRVKVI